MASLFAVDEKGTVFGYGYEDAVDWTFICIEECQNVFVSTDSIHHVDGKPEIKIVGGINCHSPGCAATV